MADGYIEWLADDMAGYRLSLMDEPFHLIAEELRSLPKSLIDNLYHLDRDKLNNDKDFVLKVKPYGYCCMLNMPLFTELMPIRGNFKLLSIEEDEKYSDLVPDFSVFLDWYESDLEAEEKEEMPLILPEKPIILSGNLFCESESGEHQSIPTKLMLLAHYPKHDYEADMTILDSGNHSK